MRMKGNGNPEVCAVNLMNLTISEVPFDRLRGRDPSMLDRPLGERQALRNARMILDVYEPRIENKVASGWERDADGNFSITLDLSNKWKEID